jgi:SanA protein
VRSRKLRWLTLGALSLLALPFVLLGATNARVLGASRGRIYRDADTVPARPVALVLGTSPRVNGRPNLFFERRMAAAAQLYQSGKVRKLLLSGDNGSRRYNEPTYMREALAKRGVPEEDVVLDYAGFRTLDSVVRAKEVFGVGRCTIVTDDFHLPRALYIAKVKGLDAIGFETVPLPRSAAPRTYWREVGARALVWLDLHVLNRQPKFLGPRETALDGSA